MRCAKKTERRRLNGAILVAACQVATGLPAGAALISSTWDGSSGNWSNPAKWSPAGVPNNGNGGNTFNVTINGGVPTLDIDPQLQRFDFNGGTFVTTGHGLFTSDLFNWTGGIFFGTGSVNILGGMNISGAGDKRLNAGFNVNFNSTGTIAASLTNESSSVFFNLSNGTINLQSGTYNSGTFHNRGVLIKTTAATYNMLPTVFDNTGTIHANEGILDLITGTTHAGLIDGDGQVTFRGATTFTPTSQLLTKTVRFAGSGATVNGLYGAFATSVDTGPLTMNGTQRYAAGSTLFARGPHLEMNTDAGGTSGAGAGNLTLGVVINSTATFNVSQRLNVLSIQSGGSAILSPTGEAGSKAIVVRQFSFDNTGKLDLTKHGAIIDHTGSSNLTVMRDLIASGYNGGAWNGPRLYSSFAAADPQTGIGYAEASDVLALSGTQTASFLGTTVDASSTLARFTLLGDANLDGTVDFNDLVRIAQNYNRADGFRTWPQGDFNYDGNVDFTDLVRVAQNYNGTLTAAPPVGAAAAFEADLARAFAVAPEPGAATGVIAAALASMRRRRRKEINPPAAPPPAPSSRSSGRTAR
jgi:hypothetical protein